MVSQPQNVQTCGPEKETSIPDYDVKWIHFLWSQQQTFHELTRACEVCQYQQI